MSKLAYRNIPLDKIYVPDERIRMLDEAHVEMLASSMQESGLNQPILVIEEGDGRFRLAAGEHRFTAAKRLGWTGIDCKVQSAVSAEEIEIYEIDENLYRKNLTAIERDISLARRKELHLKLFPEAARGKYPRGDHKGQNVPYAFSRDAAKKMGLNKRTIDRSVARISALPPDVVTALKSSPIGDNASEIERLAKMWANVPAEKQAHLLGAISRGAKTLLNAQKAVGLAPAPADPTQAALGKIESAWARAPKAAREQFLDAVAPGWRKLKIDVGAPATDEAGEKA